MQYGYYPQQGFYGQNNGAMPDTLNQFKGQYQPPMQQMQMPMQQPMQQAQPAMQMQQQPAPTAPSTGIIWVQGEAGAKSYLVAPNNTVVLWDSENQTIYIKSADGSGIPSMRTLDWVERGQTTPERTEQPEKHVCQCGDKYVVKKDFEVLEAKIQVLEKRIDEFSVNLEVEDDE